ncbi:hypothetical protein DIS24_g5360 [Lasiodiplodia hormozganensis]|uniref:Uncharacterized protein n=1 Tax=Lasiodiplodia hormozganensis TaxID=869390 RepID=A0AA39YKF7_9PEZI|nr:hypothetical protein DIS24_g5360 [Lasiodiplodia hormozganensis]
MTTSDAEPDHDNTPPAGALTTVFTMPASCSTLTENYADFDCMPPSYSKSYWGYECLTGSESWCMSTQPTTSVRTYTYYESYSDTPTTSKTTEVSIPSGYAIQVRWREQDLASLETDPLTPGASATPPPASTSHPTAILSSTLLAATTSAPANTTTSDGSGGMSTSSKVGVGVGVPLGILAIAGLLFAFCLRRRKGRRDSAFDSSGSGKDLPEVHYTSLPHNKGGPMVGVNTVSSLPSMAGSGAGVYNSYNNNNYNHPEHHPSASGSIVMSPSSTIVGGGGPRASSFSSPAPAATAQYSPAPMAQPEYIPPKPGSSVPIMMHNHAYNNSTSRLSSPSITSPPAAIVGGSGAGGGSSSGAAFAPAPAPASTSPPPLAMFASLSSLHSHDYSNDSRSIHEVAGSNGWQQGGGGNTVGGYNNNHHSSFHHDYLPGVPPSLDGAGHLDVPGISSVRSDDDNDSATIATPPSYPPAAGSGTAAFAPRGGFGVGGGSGSSEAGDRVSSEHGGSSSSNSGKGGLGASPHGDDTDEIVRLRREAQRLQERRQRLTEMQQLDEEEERVMGRLRELEGRRVVY